MTYLTLEEVIRQTVRMDKARGNGWHPVLCKVCNDKGHKGKRAGFLFDNDVCSYNCFNCSHTAIFDPTQNKTMPRKMETVLNAFGIPKQDWQSVLFNAININVNSLELGVNIGNVKVKKVDIEPKEIKFPDFFYPLTGNDKDEWDVCAREYLTIDRSINYKDYQFYLAKRTANPISKQWYGRLIIPFYKDNKLIFYQGRDLSEKRQKKYLSPDTPRENVLYGYDFILEDNEAPLYIVEGWFDAFLLRGVAVLGSRMTSNQIKWISQSRRKKVVVPDRWGDGFRLAEQALELGWSVSTPDTPGCKDVTDAVNKYGMLYTLTTIKDTTRDGFEGATRVKLYCERNVTP